MLFVNILFNIPYVVMKQADTSWVLWGHFLHLVVTWYSLMYDLISTLWFLILFVCKCNPELPETQMILPLRIGRLRIGLTYLKCYQTLRSIQSVQLLSCVWLFVTAWTVAPQASLSISSSWSFLKLMSIKPNWSHGSQPCLTQWNYEPCCVGPPKMDGSWWRVLTICGPLERGVANHFCILASRTPWTVGNTKMFSEISEVVWEKTRG